MTAAQQLADFIGLPRRIDLGEGAIMGLQDFSLETNGLNPVRITAQYVRFAARGDLTLQECTIQHYQLVEVSP
jgi:hypothetical protein